MHTLCLVVAVAALELVPAPQQMEVDKKDVFRFGPMLPVVVADDAGQAELDALSDLFAAVGYKLPVVRASEIKGGAPGIYVGVYGRHGSFESRKLRGWAKKTAALKPEGYRLRIWEKGAAVAGVDAAGAFYGLQTLIQIARMNPMGWPCMEVTDWPDLAVRGVYVKGLLTTDALKALAALKCNWVVFESGDFCDLQGVKAQAWQQVFEDARALHIEPVPVLRTLSHAEDLLWQRPEAAEGRSVSEPVTLTGDDWGILAHRNVIATETCPIRVLVSGIPCVEQVDYALERGELSAPFGDLNGPWLIRRIPGGGIPDGATVTVEYSYVPAGSSALCPSAPETAELLSGILKKIADTLKPRYVHIAHDEVTRLNQDLRCRDRGRSNAEVFADSVLLLDTLAKKASPKLRLMLWADAFRPRARKERGGLAEAEPRLPKDAVLIPRWASGDGLAWCAGLGKSVVLAVDEDNAPAAYAACRYLAGAEGRGHGVLLSGGLAENESLRRGMAKAWSVGQGLRAWPEGLNAHFGASLWSPAYAERLSALTAYLNERTVGGNEPGEVYEGFRDTEDALRRVLGGDDAELAQADRLFRNLTDYLALEAEFASKPNSAALRRLVGVVERQREVDPSFEADRVERIVRTIEGQGLFVPASILFGEQLLYYRAAATKGTLLEVPVTAAYQDTEGRAEATFDLLAAPGPVCRVDYETVGAAKVTLAQSADGTRYETVQTWTSREGVGVRGPALVDRPVAPRYLRLTAEGSSGRAVLRETRVFAIKEPCMARCAYVVESKREGQGLRQDAWPAEAQARGFVQVARRQFAEAPTEVRLCRTRTHLLVGVSAKEPRIHAMVADLTGRDAPLWEQESFEMVLDTREAGPFRFVVNPKGAQYDSVGTAGLGRGWDTGWDGDWAVLTETGVKGWTAVLTIPFATLGTAPKSGAEWGVNFTRTRYNVRQERSVWACDYADVEAPQLGVLRFN